jgi:hypothetical protein
VYRSGDDEDAAQEERGEELHARNLSVRAP